MTRALVTGSTGFIGSNLSAALSERGAEVTGLCEEGESTAALDGLDIKPVVGDILDAETLDPAMEGVDWVFHVAGIADDWNHNARRIYRTNVDGTRNVLAAAQRAGVSKFVLTSSAASLGVPRRGRDLLDESCQFNIRPRTWVYGHSKHLAEQTLAAFVKDGLHAVSVLPTGVMGRGDLKRIAGRLVTRAFQGRVFPMAKGGSNFVDVQDVVQAHIAAAERGRAGERYVLAGHNMTHVELLDIVGQVLDVSVRTLGVPRWALPAVAEGVTLLHKVGIDLPIERARVLCSGKFMYYDNRKAVRELGLNPRPFADSVRNALQWYVQNGLLGEARVGWPAKGS